MVGVAYVQAGDELLVITQQGMIIRMLTDDVRAIGRATQGVTPHRHRGRRQGRLDRSTRRQRGRSRRESPSKGRLASRPPGSRPKSRSAMRIAPLLLLLPTTLGVIGCSTAAEQSILSQFFAASRLRDITALKNIATVVFEPATQGIVTSFEITKIEPHGNGGESFRRACRFPRR